MNLSGKAVLEISARHGTLNDFGHTIFRDDDLVSFAAEIIEKNRLEENTSRNAAMKEATEKRGIEW